MMKSLKRLKRLGKGRLNTKNVLLVGVIVLVLGMVVLPTIFQPMGSLSGGFMKDGERLSPYLPLAGFQDKYANVVDAIWMQLDWVITGENVIWETFNITGFCDIMLWHYAGNPILLEHKPFSLAGAQYIEDWANQIVWDNIDLETLLDGQPYSSIDETVFMLFMYGEFRVHVAPEYEEYEGELIYDTWSDTTDGYLNVYSITGTLSGTGSINTDWW